MKIKKLAALVMAVGLMTATAATAMADTMVADRDVTYLVRVPMNVYTIDKQSNSTVSVPVGKWTFATRCYYETENMKAYPQAANLVKCSFSTLYGGQGGSMTNRNESTSSIHENEKRMQVKLQINWTGSYKHPANASRSDNDSDYSTYIYGSTLKMTSQSEATSTIFYKQ